MVRLCRKRSWHRINECENSDKILAQQFRQVRKLNSDLFNIHGIIPPAQQEISNRNASTSQFFCLPPEIRNRVYFYVFGGEQVYVGRTGDKTEERHVTRRGWYMSIGRYHAAGELHHYLNGSGTGLDLRLLRVCRRVFMEAALLPYWLNSFTFEDKEVRKAFERVVRPGKVLAQRKAVGKYEIVGKKSG